MSVAAEATAAARKSVKDAWGFVPPGVIDDALEAAAPAIRAAEHERILQLARSCRDCGKIHEKITEEVPTWPGGYTWRNDGHAYAPRFGAPGGTEDGWIVKLLQELAS